MLYVAAGRVRGGGSGQSHLREDVPVAGRTMQQDPRDEEQATVLHRRPRHCRLRNLPGKPTRPIRLKLHWFDLLWICCGLVQLEPYRQ